MTAAHWIARCHDVHISPTNLPRPLLGVERKRDSPTREGVRGMLSDNARQPLPRGGRLERQLRHHLEPLRHQVVYHDDDGAERVAQTLHPLQIRVDSGGRVGVTVLRSVSWVGVETGGWMEGKERWARTSRRTTTKEEGRIKKSTVSIVVESCDKKIGTNNG